MAVTPTYDKGATTYTPTASQAYAMVEKIARQVIETAGGFNPLSVLEKEPIDKGTTIEQAVIKISTANTFPGSTASPFDAANPDIAVRFFSKWTPFQFETAISNQEIRKVITSEVSEEEVAEKLITSLYESMYYFNYSKIRDMFEDSAMQTNCIVSAATVANNDYKKIIETIKNVADGMTFVNNTFNKAGILRRTKRENLVMLAPYQLLNSLDVQELAAVFNLEKDEFDFRIIKTDGDATKIFILDENAAQIYTRLDELDSIPNPKTRKRNYYLTGEKMYALSPLFDCAMITLTTPSSNA